MTWFINHYRCHECNVSWLDEYDCICNDRCPKCQAEIAPESSEEVSDSFCEHGRLGLSDGQGNGLQHSPLWRYCNAVDRLFPDTAEPNETLHENKKVEAQAEWVVAEIKRRAQLLVHDNFAVPTEKNYLMIESAMLIGASIVHESMLR
jgi:hypothetical protein